MHSHAFAVLALFDSFSLALLHSLSVYLSCTWLSSWQDIHFRALCVHLNEAGAANGPTDATSGRISATSPALSLPPSHLAGHQQHLPVRIEGVGSGDDF